MIFLSPLPDKEDFDKMYPPEYQNGLDLVIYSDLKIKLPGLRYDYAYQFDLIEKYAPGKNIADYGCGSANFISNAINMGYRCDGAEYNLEFIKILRQNFENVSFYSIDDFINDKTKYDVIRLSNVLEHLTHPKDILGLLRTKLVDNGILLIEGPIEENFSIAQLFRKCYFILRGIKQPGWKVSHNPTHMFFSNGLNQQRMLEHSEMEQLHFRIKEEAWPFPDKVVLKNGLGGFVKGIIAKVSIMFSVFNSSWGNTFIYVGRKK
jgi:2-polyprenyl-3-methyl-5-hydroxy-6-metoxy-1,4-benzoquinol methylase